nr:MAG TPA: hypothetical protein [Caudoviricetes sp.]DAV03024.1 MAG TPA: hypothetical protein [Caudoviricetes sp.]
MAANLLAQPSKYISRHPCLYLSIDHLTNNHINMDLN